MRIKITKPGIYGAKGEIPVGSEFTVKEEPKAWAGKYEVMASEDEAKEPIANDEPPVKEPVVGYTILDKGRGWFAVALDGEEVTKSLREEDVSGFDDLTDDEKAEFVEANAKG